MYKQKKVVTETGNNLSGIILVTDVSVVLHHQSR